MLEKVRDEISKKLEQKPKQLGLASVTLVKDECPYCTGPIAEDWAGKNPSLGTACRDCAYRKDKKELFGPENVHIVAKKELIFDPLFGNFDYHFDWAGTKIAVNGKVGTVMNTQADCAWIKFSDSENWGTPIKETGYWDLRRIYEQSGGKIEPDGIYFSKHEAKKTELLDKPILPIKVHMNDGLINDIEVGDWRNPDLLRPGDIPFMHMLNAFTNLYVRYKFGLVPNFAAEGGFIGRDFEARNTSFMSNNIGLSVSMDPIGKQLEYVRTPEELKNVAIIAGLLGMIYDREQARSEVKKQDANAYEILSVWINVMETLLRFDWTRMKNETPQDKWAAFNKMQDVLLNIMPEDELKASLKYARRNEMVHFGIHY